MSSQWVNKYAIMRDLSLAQGCVPVDVACAVGAGEKPPTQNFTEDTEEEFYSNWVGGDGDFADPDLGLITRMLEVVRDHDVSSDVEDQAETEKVIQISKLNPHSFEFKSKKAKTTLTCSPKPQKDSPKPVNVKPTVKKQRNAAIQSLLQNEKENILENNTQKLLKPNDFKVNKKNVTEAVEKVTGWLETQSESPNQSRRNTLKLALDPSSMFKKKDVPSPPKPVKEVKKSSPFSYEQFKPSEKAAEYYKKFLECSQMKEIVQEDVWTKVEKQMKQIDERRKAEAELFSLSLALCSPRRDDPAASAPDSTQEKLKMVQLPQHRHLLEEKCKVCSIMNKENQSGHPSNGNSDDNALENSGGHPSNDESDENTPENWRIKPIDEETHGHPSNVDSNHNALDSWRIKPIDEQTSPQEPKKYEDDDFDDIDSWRTEILEIDNFIEHERPINDIYDLDDINNPVQIPDLLTEDTQGGNLKHSEVFELLNDNKNNGKGNISYDYELQITKPIITELIKNANEEQKDSSKQIDDDDDNDDDDDDDDETSSALLETLDSLTDSDDLIQIH